MELYDFPLILYPHERLHKKAAFTQTSHIQFLFCVCISGYYDKEQI